MCNDGLLSSYVRTPLRYRGLVRLLSAILWTFIVLGVGQSWFIDYENKSSHTSSLAIGVDAT